MEFDIYIYIYIYISIYVDLDIYQNRTRFIRLVPSEWVLKHAVGWLVVSDPPEILFDASGGELGSSREAQTL